jgi:hypothetical protein
MQIAQLLQNLKDSPIAILLGLLVILLSSLITISNGLSILRRSYRSTLGYKGVQRRKLSRLAAGVNIGYFKEILGSAAFLNTKSSRTESSTDIDVEDGPREYIFVNKYFYVQAIADSRDRVLAFSVTSRNKRFNPTLMLGPYSTDNLRIRVRLGKTGFVELSSLARPASISSSLGARRFSYYEEYYFGNPVSTWLSPFLSNGAVSAVVSIRGQRLSSLPNATNGKMTAITRTLTWSRSGADEGKIENNFGLALRDELEENDNLN